MFRGPLDLERVQGRYADVFSKGSKLRRGRTVDLSHEDHRIYTWYSASRFRGLKSHEQRNKNHEITNRDILIGQRNSVGPQELVEWTGGTSFRISQGEVLKTSHQDSRYREL
jgi:hypothetical protein